MFENKLLTQLRFPADCITNTPIFANENVSIILSYEILLNKSHSTFRTSNADKSAKYSYRCRRHDVYSRLWISAVETNVLTCSVFDRYTIINSRCGLRTSELKTQYPSMFQMQTKPTLSALNSRVFALFVSSVVTIASATFVCNTKIAFAANRNRHTVTKQHREATIRAKCS